MNIRITVDGTPARNTFVGGKADRPVGYGFTDRPADRRGDPRRRSPAS